jgi:hypothetical protein
LRKGNGGVVKRSNVGEVSWTKSGPLLGQQQQQQQQFQQQNFQRQQNTQVPNKRQGPQDGKPYKSKCFKTYQINCMHLFFSLSTVSALDMLPDLASLVSSLK